MDRSKDWLNKLKRLNLKLNFRKFKKKYIIFFFIILTIPLTVYSLKQETNTNSHAQNQVVLQAAQDLDELSNEDEGAISPNDPNAVDMKPEQEEEIEANALSTPSVVVSGVAKPNVIVIMLDDLGAMDGRLWNYTPTIKSLFVDQGTKFTNYYSETPNCCPARSNFLTGQHTLNHRVIDNSPLNFKNNMTIATQMKKAGYNTFIAGKYLNRTELVDKTPPGWDNAYVYSGGTYNYTFYNNGVSVYKGTGAKNYGTNVIANKAIISLKDAPANKPIFGLITPWAVHSEVYSKPFPVPEEKYKGYGPCQNIPKWKPANFNEADVSDKSSYIKKRKIEFPNSGWNLVTYCETLISVDNMVKRVKNELQNQGRLNNTVFILTADNGMQFGAHRLGDKKWPYATKLPLYVYWPDGLGTTPRTLNQHISNIDMAPTICALGGCKMGPYSNGQVTPDGINFLPILLGQSNDTGRDAILESAPKPITYVPSWFAVRTTENHPDGFWHLIQYQNGERELYEVSGGACYEWKVGDSGDPCELNNLLAPGAVAPAGLTSKLQKRLNQLKKEKGFNLELNILKPAEVNTPLSTPTPIP